DTDSNVTAINNTGQVVGSSTRVEYVYVCDHYCDDYGCYDDCYYSSISYTHAFLWDAAGGMVDLQNQLQPGSDATLFDAQAINDGGSIAANGLIGGRLAGFLLTPIPPGTPSISIADAPAVTEGNAGTVDAAFTVTLSAASDQIVTVDFTTAAGSAAAGSDYQPQSGTLTFTPGETSKTITVAVIGDGIVVSTETSPVHLSSPTSAVITTYPGQGTILDAAPRLSINDVTMKEGNSGLTAFAFTVTLSVAYDLPVTVGYATANGTATAGSDYQ